MRRLEEGKGVHTVHVGGGDDEGGTPRELRSQVEVEEEDGDDRAQDHLVHGEWSHGEWSHDE